MADETLPLSLPFSLQPVKHLKQSRTSVHLEVGGLEHTTEAELRGQWRWRVQSQICGPGGRARGPREPSRIREAARTTPASGPQPRLQPQGTGQQGLQHRPSSCRAAHKSGPLSPTHSGGIPKPDNPRHGRGARDPSSTPSSGSRACDSRSWTQQKCPPPC